MTYVQSLASQTNGVVHPETLDIGHRLGNVGSTFNISILCTTFNIQHSCARIRLEQDILRLRPCVHIGTDKPRAPERIIILHDEAGAVPSFSSLVVSSSPFDPETYSEPRSDKMRWYLIIVISALCEIATCQQIWDIWQTTWNRSNLFKSLNPRPPLQFVVSGTIGDAHIVVNDNVTYQTVIGFGGSLTDSSALLLKNLKTKSATNYQSLINYLFNATEGANAAGLSYVRIPMGASDFSASQYSYDDVVGDTCLKEVDVGVTPSYVFECDPGLNRNLALKLHVVPWSPPGWMKASNTMNGGTLKPTMVNLYATYLLKALQSLKRNGVEVYAISIQNEPQYSNPTYPTSTLTAVQEARVGSLLKSLLKANGFPNVKLIECSGVYGKDWWNDAKWFMHNVFMGSIENNAKTALMWNIALDTSGNPKYPGTASCGGPGCRGIVTIKTDGSWIVNQEFYSMAQMSKATISRDIEGPSGRRIKVEVSGSASWALRVVGFVTGRIKAAEWLRYSLVVMNWNDSVGGWNPTPVKTTIWFRGMQATYTFPVGVSTLWWYAVPLNVSLNGFEVIAVSDGAQVKLEFVDPAGPPFNAA
ncbi:unnamed protein product [Cyclocybe aegerita]|uniref:Glycosyl hydrolase family 30 TIM-barrel domain-containing protein n=1 Tax=Cyclocybe aegerita TaxID=1973307 RepID=A0A8S0WHW4_CYCAE|nr:unnamed protein product [Cyclocybe aegerita]